jgi:hypothetical protein
MRGTGIANIRHHQSVNTKIKRSLEDRSVNGPHAQDSCSATASCSSLQLMFQFAPIADTMFVVDKKPVKAGQRRHLGGGGMAKTQPSAC